VKGKLNSIMLTALLKEERLYVNGRVDGLVKVYGDSGKLKELVNLENGKRHGPVSIFNENGEYETDIYYEEGKKLIIPDEVIEAPKEVALAAKFLSRKVMKRK
jgi:hypothetical protein